MEINPQEFQELKALEESLWQTKSRFDLIKMNEILAPDFFEYGRSGRIYHREDILKTPIQEIKCVIPLVDFKVRLIDINVAQNTYISIVDYPRGQERALRSSIWSRTSQKWQLRFHQGTPFPELATI